MHCWAVHICMNIKCVHEGIGFPPPNVGTSDQMFSSKLQLLFSFGKEVHTAIQLLTHLKRDKASKGLHKTIESLGKNWTVILYTMKFVYLQVFVFFSCASGAGMGFDKSEREIVISLSQFVDWAGHLQTWHGQRCNLFCFASALLSQMVWPAAIE